LDKINSLGASKSAEKTAKALLELADIDEEVVKSEDSEDIISELEATESIISDILFRYWTTNKNLRILFRIVPKEKTEPHTGTKIVEHILEIRVQNKRNCVSLLLGNRSKGFNWFFSFLVWFKKIQESKDQTYILLLDEPGLNLHAKAQKDLLAFLDDLSINYQIIYTTHSPFMVESKKLCQVRTVVEHEDGTHISDSVQEKDPNTLFPLQAALGYTLAQNLFVSSKNLIVEGISDLVYLGLMSGHLKSIGRTGLNDDITIVPAGGADRVAAFVSLFRGNDLSMVCLLDTLDHALKQRIDDFVAQGITKETKIVFYHDILKRNSADVEDLFEVADYLALCNGAYEVNIKNTVIVSGEPVLTQLKKINGYRNNHYAPANYLAMNMANQTLSEITLKNFEALFEKINRLI
jgi:predicted ATPase